jgi:hypothetical protein
MAPRALSVAIFHRVVREAHPLVPDPPAFERLVKLLAEHQQF